MVLVGLYTGQRLGDIATLTPENIDLARGEIRQVSRKTARSVIFPIAPRLRRHLGTLASGDDPTAPLHPKAHAIVTKQGKSGHLSNRFADFLAKAVLRGKKAHRKNVDALTPRDAGELSFHCLRHTAVTMLKEAGIPAAVVMELMGHDSHAMSEHYTHVGAEATQKAADSLPDIGSL